ncbi:MAG: hypothetical protein U9R79_06295 [Armatimonadota bacterium]|nr:hypothetical protein [Armatimonadota bacterium]
MSDDERERGREMLVPLNVRTYRLAIANGIMAMAAFRVADRSTVVPLLLHKLSGAAWVVGLVLGLWRVVRTLVQVLAARSLDGRDYKKPAYILSALARGSMYVLIALVLWWGAQLSNTLVLVVLIFGLMGHSGGGAVASLAFNDILAKSIPTTRRGSLQMWRRVGALAIVLLGVTPLVAYMVGPESPFDFPRNFATLFAVSVMGSAIGWTLFGQVREPASRSSSRQPSWLQHLARGWEIIHQDRSYRRLIRIRLLMGLSSAVRPFFIVFATQVWGMPDEVAATFLGLQVGAEMVGAAVVGQVSDRFGNRNAVLVGVSSLLAGMVAAVAAAFGSWDVSLSILWWTVNLQVVVLGLAFVGCGLFLASLMIGYMNYLMDIAPESERPSYMGFGAGFTFPLALAPLVYGWAADGLGYRVVFTAALVLALGAFFFGLKLPEPRDDLDDSELEAFIRQPDMHEEPPEGE